MNQEEISRKIHALKTHPELADTPEYNVEELLPEADAAEWFELMMEQPRFAPQERDWWHSLRFLCGLPWAELLAKQPQLEEHCHWESVSRLELVKLAYLAPAIFAKRFPNGRPWDLWAFLTPIEKVILLRDLPQLENAVSWEELDQEWSTGMWLILLAYQPQFEKYFDWSRIEKKPTPYWEVLLSRQPQFACHCDLAHLEDWQIRRIQKHQPQLFEEEKKA